MGVVLTRVLKEAIPFDSTSVVSVRSWTVWGSHFYYYIPRFETGWWWRFKEIYPHWLNAALRHEAVFHSSTTEADACPGFSSVDDLIDWLSEVLELPKGVENLLRIEARREGVMNR